MPKGVYNRNTAKTRTTRFPYDRDELKRRYESGETTVSIGKELNFSPQAVMYWCKMYGIKMRDPHSKENLDRIRKMAWKKTTLDVSSDEVVKMYQERKTPNQIAHKFNCSWDTVMRKLHRAGITIRVMHKHGKRGRRTITESRQFQKLLLKVYGYSCAICRYDKFVNACHIIPRMNGGGDTVENGIVLCPNHHAELDYGIITPEEITKYQVKRHSPTLRVIGE